MRVLVLCALLALSACITTEERQARAVASAAPACESYGFRQGTPEHAQCVMLLVENEKQNREALRRGILLGVGDTPAQTTAPMRPPVYCQQMQTGTYCH